MEATTGIFQILAAVIAVGGAAKLVAPAAFAETLTALRVNGGKPVAMAAGGFELAIGVGAIVIGGSAAALVVAATYAVFAVTVVMARKAGASSCGCFGSVAAPPSGAHVVVNCVSALLALGAAAASPLPLLDVLADQPLAGVPYLVLLGVGVWLTIAIDTVGAQLLDEMSAVQELGPVLRENGHPRTARAHSASRPTRSPRPG